MYNSRYEILNKHSSPLDIIFLELEGIDIKCLIISSILKEILQFYNNEKSHDFNKDSLRTRLRMFVANLLGGPWGGLGGIKFAVLPGLNSRQFSAAPLCAVD